MSRALAGVAAEAMGWMGWAATMASLATGFNAEYLIVSRDVFSGACALSVGAQGMMLVLYGWGLWRERSRWGRSVGCHVWPWEMLRRQNQGAGRHGNRLGIRILMATDR
jgi:hypothetical protein